MMIRLKCGSHRGDKSCGHEVELSERCRLLPHARKRQRAELIDVARKQLSFCCCKGDEYCKGDNDVST